jgi:hypothetical protein
MRMSHQKEGGWCHAFDVEMNAYQVWKSGLGPLSAFAAYLPKGGHPPLGTQVSCGTCGSINIVPREMKQEPV